MHENTCTPSTGLSTSNPTWLFLARLLGIGIVLVEQELEFFIIVGHLLLCAQSMSTRRDLSMAPRPTLSLGSAINQVGSGISMAAESNGTISEGKKLSEAEKQKLRKLKQKENRKQRR